MKNRLLPLLAFLIFLSSASANAQAHHIAGTREEAMNLSAAAATLIDKIGPESAYVSFDDPETGFLQKDLYVFVYNMEGVCQYHGKYKNLEHQNLINLKDMNGTPIIGNIVNVCQSNGPGWTEYLWMNREEKKIFRKHSYITRTSQNLCVGVGYYEYQ